VTYALKEVYYTLQGEGAQAGRAAVFARFAGCNLWSGLERDRATAQCTFCDTDFVGVDGEGGGKFKTASELASHLRSTWNAATGTPYVVFTGGEPMLQLDEPLIDACHQAGFEVAIETNGTLVVPESVDWICVSPKPASILVQRSGQELKLVYPHEVTPDSVVDLDFEHRFLQPMDGPDRDTNTAAVIAVCRQDARWRLSLQVHKLVGIP
jgi:7-carboxy-7-deazaguanine synthase